MALAAVGYTIFALVQGQTPAPHRADSVQSAVTTSPSGPGTPTASPSGTGSTAPPSTAGGAGQGAVQTAGHAGAAPPATSRGAASATRTSSAPATGRSAAGGSPSGGPAPTSQVPASATEAVPETPTAPGTPATPSTSQPAGPAAGTLTPGSGISLRATTAGYTTRYVRHQNGRGITSVITSSSPSPDKNDASWIVRTGLASASCVSFESSNYPGTFLRHSNFQLYRQPMDGTALFRADATFCPASGKNGTGISFASYNYPAKFLRHYNNMLYIASNGGGYAWDSPVSWADDVSWVVTSAWAS